MLSPLPRRSGWACQLSEIFRLPTSLTKRESGASWLMLRGLFVVKQPTVFDGLAFYSFSFQQVGLTAPEVDVGRGEIVDALLIAPVVVVRDECIDLSFEIAGQIIVLEQDAVLERLMPALDFPLRHRMKAHHAYVACPAARAIWPG